MSDAQLYVKIALYSQIVSAIVFIAVLIYMWLRWILPVVMSAQERSNKQIAEAERHRDEARDALTTLRGEIDGARRDAGLIVERAEVHARHEREATLAKRRRPVSGRFAKPKGSWTVRAALPGSACAMR